MESKSGKKVSQEYFDQIVSENITEFEMSATDAIEDAINQLKSQGVDLSMICKFSLEERAQLAQALANLNELVDKLIAVEQSASDLYETGQTLLNTIKEKFSTDLSFRCFATQLKPLNCYAIFMKYLAHLNATKEKKLTDVEHTFVEAFLKTFDAYVHQQSDVLNTSGLSLLIELTNDDQSRFDVHQSVLQYTLKCISSGCLLNEPNRQYLVEHGLCENLMRLIKKHKRNELVLCQVCQLIRCLLLDDDLRVEYGKSHEHAKFIASELNGIDVLLQIGLGQEDVVLQSETLANIMLTLSKLAVRNEFCQEICDKGGLRFVLQSIEEKHLKNTSLLKSSLSLLKSVCNNDQVKYEATKSNAIGLLQNVLLAHLTDNSICELCCSALATLLLRNTEANDQFYALQVHPILVKLLANKSSKPRLIKQCCFALRNSISRNKSYGEKLLELKIEPILVDLMSNKEFASCHEDAKTVLRDLGCEIHLKELWTGTGKNLAQD